MQALLLFVVLLLAPCAAWAQAAQETESFASFVNTEAHLEAQLIRCDNTPGIAPTTETPLSGQACEAGDWTTPLDCRGTTNIGVRYFEYSAAGTSTAKVWDCLRIPGPAGLIATQSTLGGSIPGVEAPGGAPSAADPDPLCVSLDTAAGVTLSGTTATTQLMNLSNQTLHFIVGEIDACTNCDSTLVVSCGR